MATSPIVFCTIVSSCKEQLNTIIQQRIAREDAKYLRGLIEQEDAKQKRNARFKSGGTYAETSSQTLNGFKAVSKLFIRLAQY